MESEKHFSRSLKLHKSLSCLYDMKPKIWNTSLCKIMTSKKHVAIITNDVKPTEEQRYLIDIAFSLQNSGVKMTFVTWGKVMDEKLITVLKYGRWIPRSIFGYLEEQLHTFRAVYLALLITFLSPTPEIIFCDEDPFLAYILKIFKFRKVILLYKFSGKPTNESELEYLKFSDMILVPSKINKRILNLMLELEINKPDISVLYPCAETELSPHFEYFNQYFIDVTNGSYVFTMFGEYLPESNFELGVNAFCLLLENLKWMHKNRTFLIIAGKCEKSNVAHQNCLRKLTEIVEDKGLERQVKFVQYLTKINKKILLRLSLAVVHLGSNEKFNRIILQAMFFGKPVIALNNGFSKEVIEYAITGYLLEPLTNIIAEAMYEFIFNKNYTDFMNKLCLSTYKAKYSLQSFQFTIVNLVFDILYPHHEKIKISRKQPEEEIECQEIWKRFEDFKFNELMHEDKLKITEEKDKIYVEMLPNHVSDFQLNDKRRKPRNALVFV